MHDALLIQAPLERLDEDIFRMRAHMEQASRIVLGGFTVRTDVVIVKHPPIPTWTSAAQSFGTQSCPCWTKKKGKIDNKSKVEAHLERCRRLLIWISPSDKGLLL